PASGFIKIDANWYLWVEAQKTWSDAEAHCQSLHSSAHLTDVPSLKLNTRLINYARHNQGGNFWTSGNDQQTDGQWVWQHPGTSVGFTNWRTDEPNGGTNENCMMVYSQPRETHHTQWNDAPCSETVSFICKI
ncbi:alpha-N-acetylgalactosamine-specific lectin-like, partial [Lingula anatina]